MNLALGKNGGYTPSSVGGTRSISVGRQASRQNFCDSTTSIQ